MWVSIHICVGILPGMLSGVFPHVDEREGDLGRVEGRLHHGGRVPHEGVDRAVGGGAGVHVQQHRAGRRADRVRYRIDNLAHSVNMIKFAFVSNNIYIDSIKYLDTTFLSLPSEKLGTHSIILDIF